MLVPFNALKIGDKFFNLQDETIYKVVSEPVDNLILCATDDGFGELFGNIHLVRPIFSQK